MKRKKTVSDPLFRTSISTKVGYKLAHLDFRQFLIFLLADSIKLNQIGWAAPVNCHLQVFPQIFYGIKSVLWLVLPDRCSKWSSAQRVKCLCHQTRESFTSFSQSPSCACPMAFNHEWLLSSHSTNKGLMESF